MPIGPMRTCGASLRTRLADQTRRIPILRILERRLHDRNVSKRTLRTNLQPVRWQRVLRTVGA